MGKDLKGKELGIGLSQRKDGLYTARFTTKRGKRLQHYSPKLRECKQWLANAQFNDKNDTPDEFEIPTLDEWFKTWLRVKEAIIKPSTKHTYTLKYNKAISPTLGKMRIDKIKPMHCQELLTDIRDKSQKTINLTRTILHNLLEFAVENELIEKNPVTKKVKVKSQVEEKERRVLSKKEQEDFLKDTMGSKYHNVFAFLLQTGLRIGEIFALSWEDIDFEKRIMHIRHSLIRINKEEILSSPKTKAGIRDIPLTNKAIKILKEQKNKSVKGYVFKELEGIKTDYLDDYLKRYYKKKKIPKFSVHTLRHTFATRCIENGMKPKTLQSILGHSSLSMTMDLYVHSTNESKIEEMSRIEAFL